MKFLNEKRIKIAIDSPAAAGAGTVAKKICKHYNLLYLDTGKIYRYLAYQKIKNPKIFSHNFIKNSVKNLKASDLSKKNLIKDEIGFEASKIAKDKIIRKLVHKFQFDVAYNPPKKFNGSCLDGRDITYKIIPDADFKFFITADIKIRAKRRFKQLYSTNKSIEFKNILLDLEKRDISDKSRKNSPLILSEDSIFIDTEFLNPQQVLKKALYYIKKNK